MTAEHLLPFVSMELARPLGPPEGTYLVAGPPGSGGPDPDGAGQDTLVLAHRDATPLSPRGLPGRRARSDEAGPVELTIVTHVLASSACVDRRAAADLLASWRGAQDEGWSLVERALDVINLAVRAHRVAERHPYTMEVCAGEPRVIRLGYGTPDEVVHGRWTEMYQLARRGRRARGQDLRVRDAAMVADVLAGRATLPDAVELLLGAERDIDQSRLVIAALQLRDAVSLLHAEPGATVEIDPALVRRGCALADRVMGAEPLAGTELLAELEAVADGVWAHLGAASAAR